MNDGDGAAGLVPHVDEVSHRRQLDLTLKERTNQINQFYNCTFNFHSNHIEYCCSKIVSYLEQILENKTKKNYQPPVKFSDYCSNCNPETVITMISIYEYKLDRLQLNLLLFLFNKTGCFFTW